jgi:hypothetical protein
MRTYLEWKPIFKGYMTETDFKEKMSDLVAELNIVWDRKDRDKILKELRDLLNLEVTD